MKHFKLFFSITFHANSLIEALIIMLILSVTILGGIRVLNDGILELKNYEKFSKNNRVIISVLEILKSKNFKFTNDFTIDDIPVGNFINLYFEVISDDNFNINNEIYLNKISIDDSRYVCKEDRYLFDLACVVIEFVSKDITNNNFVIKIYGLQSNMKIQEGQSFIYRLSL